MVAAGDVPEEVDGYVGRVAGEVRAWEEDEGPLRSFARLLAMESCLVSDCRVRLGPAEGEGPERAGDEVELRLQRSFGLV